MADETTNDDHAKALIDALLPAVTKAVEEQVAKRIEAMDKEMSERLDGIASKNAQLLGKLHKEKGERVSLEDQLATLNKHLSGDNKPTEIVIDKQTARDPRAYRAAKAEAEKAGVPLRIDREAL